MTDGQEVSAAARGAVLQVSPRLVEWYEPGGSGEARYARVVPQGAGPGALAAAAQEAWRQAGATTRRCVLLLEQGLVEERSLRLPELKRKELFAVLRRKAAGLFSGEDVRERDVLFHALDDGRHGADGLSEWSLVAMRGAVLRRLRVLLRQRGFRVQRIAAGHLAALARGQAAGDDPDQPFLSIVVREDGVHVNLVHGATVLSRGHLEGNPSTNPGVAAGLLHEVRSAASFWKRKSRGEKLAKVVVMGLQHDRGLLLANAIEAALVDTEIHLIPGREDSQADPRAGRFALLSAAMVEAPISPNLSFRIPPSRARVAAVVLASVGLAGTLAWHLRERIRGELSELRAEITLLADRSRDLRPLVESEAALASGGDELARSVERIARIGSHGVPLHRILEGALTAFSGRTELLSARLEGLAGGGYELRIDAEVRGTTSQVLACLCELRETLRANEAFDEVILELGDRLPESPQGALPFAVTVRGRNRVAG